MNDPIRRLRTDARHLTHGKVPTAVRYPAAFQTAAVALARPRLSRGRSIARVARELGLPSQALGRWLRRTPAAPEPRSRRVLRPVAVVPAAAAVAGSLTGPVLLTAQGLRVEGLDRDDLIAVLRALA
jgi:transposase-like protein